MIAPAQSHNLQIKPRWQAPVGVMESVVAYNCRKYGMPHPVLAMPMWEGAGNRAIDLSGHGNNGSLIGQPEWVADGLDFNGSTDYVDVDDSVSLDISGAITINAWVYMHSAGSYPSVITKRAGASDHAYCFEFSTNTRKINLYLENVNESWTKISNTAVPLNVWTQITAVYDGVDNIAYYHNGVPDGSYTVIGGAILKNNEPVTIGKREDGYAYDGTINEANIFNTALTPSQVKFLYDNPYFMYRLPEELYGYSPAVVGAIMNQFQKSNLGADLYNGAIIA